MQIRTFKVDQYGDHKIIYRNFGDHFEYFVIIGGELYSSHITVKPHWLTSILYKVGISEWPYSEQQLKKIIGILRRMAETTTDFVTKPDEETEKVSEEKEEVI